MNLLWLEQQSFRNLVEPFIWNYIIEYTLDGDNEDKDKEEDDDEDDAATRSRGRELRNVIPLPTSNHPTPPPSQEDIVDLLQLIVTPESYFFY
jgi:hypothetical protein